MNKTKSGNHRVYKKVRIKAYLKNTSFRAKRRLISLLHNSGHYEQTRNFAARIQIQTVPRKKKRHRSLKNAIKIPIKHTQSLIHQLSVKTATENTHFNHIFLYSKKRTLQLKCPLGNPFPWERKARDVTQVASPITIFVTFPVASTQPQRPRLFPNVPNQLPFCASQPAWWQEFHTAGWPQKGQGELPHTSKLYS